MKKDQGIESLRGLAILLLVALHAAPPPLSNIGVMEGEGFWAYVSYSVALLRMPLFTVISGYVYALRPLQGGPVGAFLSGKGRRLLLPFVTLSTLTFVMMKAVGSETAPWGEMWRIYVFPYQHFWFVQALALVFLAITWLERRQLLRTPRTWVFVLLGALLLQQGVDVAASSSRVWAVALSVACFSGAAYLLPFFVLGLGLRRFGGTSSFPLHCLAGGMVLAAVTLQQLTWFGQAEHIVTKTSLLGVLTSIAATFLLLQHRHRIVSVPLARLGTKAYTIYLFHGFGLAFATRTIGMLGLEDPHMTFMGKVIGALLLPVAAEQVLQRLPAARLMFLGIR